MLSDSPAEHDMHIRRMEHRDAAQVALLATELGYPLSADLMQMRFDAIAQRHQEHAAFVADNVNALAGWVHVYGVHTIAGEPYAEVSALVVSNPVRRQGIGRSLMRAAEDWADQRGYPKLRLRSGLQREHEAHLFYAGIGYTPVRASMLFEKKIGAEPDVN